MRREHGNSVTANTEIQLATRTRAAVGLDASAIIMMLRGRPTAGVTPMGNALRLDIRVRWRRPPSQPEPAPGLTRTRIVTRNFQ